MASRWKHFQIWQCKVALSYIWSFRLLLAKVWQYWSNLFSGCRKFYFLIRLFTNYLSEEFCRMTSFGSTISSLNFSLEEPMEKQRKKIVLNNSNFYVMDIKLLSFIKTPKNLLFLSTFDDLYISKWKGIMTFYFKLKMCVRKLCIYLMNKLFDVIFWLEHYKDIINVFLE